MATTLMDMAKGRSSVGTAHMHTALLGAWRGSGVGEEEQGGGAAGSEAG